MSSVLASEQETVSQHEPLKNDKLAYVVLALLAVGYGLLMFAHWKALWSKPQYQYFPFVFAAVGYFFYRSHQLRTPQSRKQLGNWALFALVGMAWVALAIGTYLYDPWFAAVSLNLLVGVAFLLISRKWKMVNLFGIWMLLWLTVPPPEGLDQKLIVFLQALSSNISSHVLDLLHVNHIMLGNALEVPGKQFFVDEACSGIVSVMSVIACAAVFGVWANRSLLHMSILLVSSVIWAVVMNLVRITTIAVAYVWWDIDLSSGSPHEILGLVLFTLTFVAMMSTDRILLFLFEPINLGGEIAKEVNQNKVVLWFNSLVGVWNPLQEREPTAGSEAIQMNWLPFSKLAGVAAAFTVLGVLAVALWGFPKDTSAGVVTQAQTTSETIAPEAFGNWQLEGFEAIEREENDEYGQYSKAYRYRDTETDTVALVSFDFPYRGSWHDLATCYRMTGWTQLTHEKSGQDWTQVEATFSQGAKHGFLVFSIFDHDGHRASPPDGGLSERFWRRVRRRGPASYWPLMFQVQIWVESQEELSDTKKSELRRAFRDVRERFRNFSCAVDESTK